MFFNFVPHSFPKQAGERLRAFRPWKDAAMNTKVATFTRQLTLGKGGGASKVSMTVEVEKEEDGFYVASIMLSDRLGVFCSGMGDDALQAVSIGISRLATKLDALQSAGVDLWWVSPGDCAGLAKFVWREV